MKRFLLTLIGLVFFLGISTMGFGYTLKDANALYNAKKYTEAEQAYRSLLPTSGNDFSVYHNLAMSCFLQRNADAYQRTVNVCNEAIKKGIKGVFFYERKAISLHYLNKEQEVIKTLENVPNLTYQGKFFLAQAYKSTHQIDKAQPLLLWILKNYPTNWYSVLGFTWVKWAEMPDAEKDPILIKLYKEVKVYTVGLPEGKKKESYVAFSSRIYAAMSQKAENSVK